MNNENFYRALDGSFSIQKKGCESIMTREEFIKKIAPLIVKYAPQYNILCPSAVIAQAVLESDGGNSELATNAHNYFGLKYRVGRCPTACGIYHKVGSEQNPDGSYVSSAMQWMKFSNMEDGVRGYFDFINIANYANVKGVTDSQKYLENIKADGYATSISYVSNVMNVVKKYNLTQYDPVETSTKKYYRVNCGSFTIKANAIKLQEQLKASGFDAIVKRVGLLWKTQVGAYSNKLNAEAMVTRVVAKGFKAFITYS